MLVLRTGLPGHSKTLNSIKEIDSEAFASSRSVYYHNIPDLSVEKLKASWFPFDDPLLWFELPENSIIVVDEAQGWFGSRDTRKEMPRHLSEFETHRHKAFDVHLITQHGMFLDAHVRRLTGKHIYYWRLFGGNRVSRYEFEKYSDTDKTSDLKLGRRSIIKLDRSFFGLYKSAVAHNSKFRPPLVIFGLIGLVIVLICLGFLISSRLDARSEVKSSAKPDQPLLSDARPGRPLEGSVYSPRVDGLPSSAPIYDQLTVPTVSPKLTCFYSDDQSYNSRNPAGLSILQGSGQTLACGCFTQQGTRYDVAFDLCRAYAVFGSFDSTPVAKQGYRK